MKLRKKLSRNERKLIKVKQRTYIINKAMELQKRLLDGAKKEEEREGILNQDDLIEDVKKKSYVELLGSNRGDLQ